MLVLLLIQLFPELRQYYSDHLPFLYQQPLKGHQVAPSILEAHAIQVTAHQEWEAEWHRFGLASRLTPEVNILDKWVIY